MTVHTDASVVAAIDLGASKASCLIARLEGEGLMTPLGVGRQTMRRGADAVGADADGAARLLAIAFDNAVRMAGVTPSLAYVCFSGPGIASARTTAAVALGAGVVNERSLEAVNAALARAAARKGAVAARLIDVRYRVDAGAPTAAPPLGAKGQMLQAEALAALAPQAGIDAAEALCAKAGVYVMGAAPAPLCAAQAVLRDQERIQGAAVVDIGAAHTGLAIVGDGDVVHLEALDVGADHITAKIAAELGATRAAAERVKVAHADVSGALDPRHVVELALIGADGRLAPGAVLRGALDLAARTACMDVLATVRARLDAIDPGALLPVALTGGGAQMAGLSGLAERAFGRSVRIAAPIGFGVIDTAEGGPGFAAAAGALRLISADVAARAHSGITLQPRAANLPATMGKAWAWIRENL